MFRGILHAISKNSPSSVSLPNSLETSHRALRRTQPIHTLASMSSVAAAADAPEEFTALADDAVDDFMSEAASDVPEQLYCRETNLTYPPRPLIGVAGRGVARCHQLLRPRPN